MKYATSGVSQGCEKCGAESLQSQEESNAHKVECKRCQTLVECVELNDGIM